MAETSPGSRSSQRSLRAVLRRIVSVLVLSALAAMGYLLIHGAWLPGQPPKRLFVCGRTYLRGVVQQPAASDVAVRVGRYPVLIGAPIRSSKDCHGYVPTGLWLHTDHGEVGYALSGGP